MKQFKTKDTERVFRGSTFPACRPRSNAVRVCGCSECSLAATALSDPRLPSRRLKASSGDRKGRHSNRVNDQWRVCFLWTEHGAMELGITDCH